jgi:hypothetical protein
MPPHWKTKNTRPSQPHQPQQQQQQHSLRSSSISISSSSRPPPRPPPQKSHLIARSHPQQHQSDLRHAYQSQGNIKTHIKKKDHHNNKNKNNNKNNPALDDHCSSSSSIATPSSVYMPSVPLSRDNMSDLSGLSGGTRSSSVVPGQIFDPKTFLQPWRQAYCLSVQPQPSSSIPPPQSSRIDPSHQGKINNNKVKDGKETPSNGRQGSDHNLHLSNNKTTNRHGPNIWVEQNDSVEIFGNLHTTLGLDGFPREPGLGKIQPQQHNRTPIIILLMDPNQHCYELMQIWVDRAMDSIRDLMQALQQRLSQDLHQHHQHSTQQQQLQQQHQPQQQQQQEQLSWKQAYDGIFQVRGHRFTQLINIIRLLKYDIQPHEILVAKPWAMSAKLT